MSDTVSPEPTKMKNDSRWIFQMLCHSFYAMHVSWAQNITNMPLRPKLRPLWACLGSLKRWTREAALRQGR